MLRNCPLPSSYEQTRNSITCGEIICYDNKSFTIICMLCKMKIFDFDDFILHYQNVHLRGSYTYSDSDSANDGELEACIKDVEFENVEYLAELNDSFSIVEKDDGQPVRVLGGTVKKELEKESNVENKAYSGGLAAAANDHNDSSNNGHEINFEANEYNEAFDDDYDDDIKRDDDEWEPNDEDEDGHILKKLRKPKEYRCEQCQKCYTTERILKLHINMKHLRPKLFKCDQCEEKFTEQRSLDSHRQKNHIGYPCTQCERTYKNSRSLRVHMQTHTSTKKFKCDNENCGKAFISMARLKVHLKIHTDERNYICEICGYRTRHKDALVVHKRTHTGEKPFECSICKRRFMSASLLNEHKPMHSTDRPHKCDVCGAAFSRAKALYHHKHLHLGVKKFVCKLCGRAYAQMAGLAGHMRQHRAEEQSLQD